MLTDPLPQSARGRRLHAESDQRARLAPAPPEIVRSHTVALADAMAAAADAGDANDVGHAASALVAALSECYRISAPHVRVLGVRPHKVQDGVCTYQLFGDYAPATERIRVWMRTAIRKQVSSPRALLNTLLHEFCHHLDNKLWRCPESPHTRGFFARVDQLYHHALATPSEARRPLVWVKVGSVYRIDWRSSRSRPRPAAFAPRARLKDQADAGLAPRR